VRLLTDENIPSALVVALVEAGHEVATVRERAGGAADLDVARLAEAENRILLTFDKDFGWDRRSRRLGARSRRRGHALSASAASAGTSPPAEADRLATLERLIAGVQPKYGQIIHFVYSDG
jgi:hypothetical protein